MMFLRFKYSYSDFLNIEANDMLSVNIKKLIHFFFKK